MIMFVYLLVWMIISCYFIRLYSYFIDANFDSSIFSFFIQTNFDEFHVNFSDHFRWIVFDVFIILLSNHFFHSLSKLQSISYGMITLNYRENNQSNNNTISYFNRHEYVINDMKIKIEISMKKKISGLMFSGLNTEWNESI